MVAIDTRLLHNNAKPEDYTIFFEKHKYLSKEYENFNINTLLCVDTYSQATLPPEVDTPKAKNILQRAVDIQLIAIEDGSYRWRASSELLAYFCQECSFYLQLRKGKLDANNHQTVSWKPFETLFRTKRISSGKDSWMKTHTTFHPIGHEIIDALFHSDDTTLSQSC